MTRQQYSIRESLNRILRLFQDKAVPTDVPNTVPGDVLSEDGALSDLAELFAGSLPGETATLPSAITVPAASIPAGSFSTPGHVHPTYDLVLYDDSVFKATGTAISFNGNLNVVVSGTTVFISPIEDTTLSTLQVGTSPNYMYVESDGTVRLTGTATAWEDLRVDGLSTRVGVVAPTDEVGFKGNNNFYARNFVHTQADEVQFHIQYPHQMIIGSDLSPHVHFSPWITGTNDVQAVRFILEYYWAGINEEFGSGTSYTMAYTWTGSNQWVHLIADGELGEFDTSGKGLSSMMKCRLYRDNTIANNLAGKITFLYFDVHYMVDSLGSKDEYVK